MPQFDVTTFPTQLIWLVIAFIILYVLMERVALPRIGQVLEERQEKIDDNLDAAEQLRTEAESEAEAYEAALVQAREQARGAIQEAARNGAEEASRRQEELGRNLADQIKAAEENIVAAKQDAVASIREVALVAAGNATERLIGIKPSEAAVAAAVDRALDARVSEANK
ncbi:MAG: F0F1 ATP synthase subunit B' [Pseudomonadota bacterium]|nr:F0F1 ATP synthase subunit B' [Pseudomonadota bacterium]